jgi:1-acyl-sn-glycerol-3-phosphate acyltransferase
MFVANHCSWMDIPFIGANLGTRNYKVVSKVDLLKVPILGKSLRVAKHIILDRSSRRSQLNTYKSGVAMMKAGVNLVTFAEGTRSRTGRLGPFKAGAFKMAESVDADIVPVAISYAHRVQPLDYVFPVRMSRRMPATISFGEPISTEGKTDAAVIEEVWDSIARQLPESQKPLEGTPKSIK